jgi:hypothetical protein
VGRDVDVDFAVGQAMLPVEPPVVLDNLLTIVSLQKGVPQQHGKVVMVQACCAQPTFLEDAVRVICHLRQDFERLDFSMKR